MENRNSNLRNIKERNSSSLKIQQISINQTMALSINHSSSSNKAVNYPNTTKT